MALPIEARANLTWREEKDDCTYPLPTEAENAYLRRGPAPPLAMGSECSVS